MCLCTPCLNLGRFLLAHPRQYHHYNTTCSHGEGQILMLHEVLTGEHDLYHQGLSLGSFSHCSRQEPVKRR